MVQRQTFLLNLSLFLGAFRHTAFGINVTLMVYGVWPAYLTTSIPFLAPGYDVGISAVKKTYEEYFDMNLVFVSSRNVRGCEDMPAYVDDVARYYHGVKASDHKDDVLVLASPGAFPWTVTGTFGRIHHTTIYTKKAAESQRGIFMARRKTWAPNDGSFPAAARQHPPKAVDCPPKVMGIPFLTIAI